MPEPWVTQEQVDAMLPAWKEILLLQDWRIELQVCKKLGDSWANCRADHKYKEALIKFSQRPPKPQYRTIPYDQEETLVHELLHIHHTPIDLLVPEGSPEDLALETMINQLAKSLVKLKRESDQWQRLAKKEEDLPRLTSLESLSIEATSN